MNTDLKRLARDILTEAGHYNSCTLSKLARGVLELHARADRLTEIVRELEPYARDGACACPADLDAILAEITAK